MAVRPRRHSVVTLRLTVAADADVLSDDYRREPSVSPTLVPRSRQFPRPRHRGTSPLCRTPTSPLCRSPSPMARSPPSPLARTPTSPRARTPTSPHPQTPVSPRSPLQLKSRDSSSPVPGRSVQSPVPGRSVQSPVSPRSTRVFRYDYEADERDGGNLRRRSSLLTVPSAHEMQDYYNRSSRQRSCSLAGPVRPPPDLIRYLNETAAVERILGAARSSSSSSNSSNSPEEERRRPRRSPIPRSLPISPEHSSLSFQTRRHSNTADPSASGTCRLRQFSTTSGGRVVNRGDSLRPRRSASNTSVNSTISSASREKLPSSDSDFNTTPIGSRGHSPIGSRGHSPASSRQPTPSTTPVPVPKYYIGMIGAPGVGRSSIVTQFMTSEYMCAYDDSSDESGSERSVSVVLDGEEAELIFVRIQDLKKGETINDALRLQRADTEALRLQRADTEALRLQRADTEALRLQRTDTEGEDPSKIDAWAVIYSVSDRMSFRDATAALGHIWAKGGVDEQAVILVANKTDLERTRVVSTAEGRKLAKTYECKFIEVSAGFAHHVDELLVGILVQIRLKHRNKMSENFRMSKGSIKRLGETLRHKNSFKVKGLIGKILCRSRTTKSCENLHML